MKTVDRLRWMEKTERLNDGVTLKVGDHVTDPYGKSGTVTAIDDWSEDGPLTVENHGSITVDVAGEEEHYTLYTWRQHLRITP